MVQQREATSSGSFHQLPVSPSQVCPRLRTPMPATAASFGGPIERADQSTSKTGRPGGAAAVSPRVRSTMVVPKFRALERPGAQPR